MYSSRLDTSKEQTAFASTCIDSTVPDSVATQRTTSGHPSSWQTSISGSTALALCRIAGRNIDKYPCSRQNSGGKSEALYLGCQGRDAVNTHDADTTHPKPPRQHLPPSSCQTPAKCWHQTHSTTVHADLTQEIADNASKMRDVRLLSRVTAST